VNLRIPLLVAGYIASAAVLAHQGEQHAASPAPTSPSLEATANPSPREKAARLFFSDRRLITQHGKEVVFYSDVLKDKVVLINFIFTHCHDSCPTQSSKLSQVQSLLGGLVGREVRLVSISVDPEPDTAEKLAEYAGHFNAGNGWTFLTGDKENVNEVVRRLGQLAPTPESHTTLFILGNVKTSHWIKLHPDVTPATITEHLRTLASESTMKAPPGTR
jgi:protein SCO1/2